MNAGKPADSPEAMDGAEAHRQQINDAFYDCSYEIHVGLAEMYLADPRFTATYEKIAPGLAQYLHDAIKANAARQGGVGLSRRSRSARPRDRAARSQARAAPSHPSPSTVDEPAAGDEAVMLRANRCFSRSRLASMSPPAAEAIIGSMKRVSIEPRISMAKLRSVSGAVLGRRQVQDAVRLHAADLAADGEAPRRVVLGDGQRCLDCLAHQLARDERGPADAHLALGGPARAR